MLQPGLKRLTLGFWESLKPLSLPRSEEAEGSMGEGRTQVVGNLDQMASLIPQKLHFLLVSVSRSLTRSTEGQPNMQRGQKSGTLGGSVSGLRGAAE